MRDVVFSNEFYILALQLAQPDIAGLYPFWQQKQSELRYELTIVRVLILDKVLNIQAI